jgi:hypothetical protein
MKKPLILFSSFLILAIVFYFTEERQSDLQEIEFWKLNPSKLIYSPPNENSIHHSKFSKDELIIEKKEIGLKNAPLFFIKGKSKSNNNFEYTYEANYNIKNLFSELSILRTKSINESKEEYLKKFSITPDSPKLEIYESNKLSKTILIGEEDKNSNRYIQSDKYLILIQNFPIQKLTNSIFENRERTYARTGEYELNRVQIQTEGLQTSIENQIGSKNGSPYSKWFRVSSGKTRIDPILGGNFFSALQNLKVDLYPDEENGEGFEIAKELVNTKPNTIIDVYQTNGVHMIIKVFPKVVIKEKTYFPILKEIENHALESVSYTKQESYTQLIDTINKIQTAGEWNEPKPN